MQSHIIFLATNYFLDINAQFLPYFLAKKY